MYTYESRFQTDRFCAPFSFSLHTAHTAQSTQISRNKAKTHEQLTDAELAAGRLQIAVAARLVAPLVKQLGFDAIEDKNVSADERVGLLIAYVRIISLSVAAYSLGVEAMPASKYM
jgi:hypothetical protein